VIDPERRGEAGRHIVQVTVPAPDQPVVRHGDELFVERVSWSEQHDPVTASCDER